MRRLLLFLDLLLFAHLDILQRIFGIFGLLNGLCDSATIFLRDHLPVLSKESQGCF